VSFASAFIDCLRDRFIDCLRDHFIDCLRDRFIDSSGDSRILSFLKPPLQLFA
jgi:hypothetical protein